MTIKLGGARLFTIQDPYLWNLHVGYIQEFRPLRETLRNQGWSVLATGFPIWPWLFFPAVWMLAKRRVPAGAAGLLAVASGAALPMSGLAIFQMRWFGVAESLWLALVFVLICLWQTAPPASVRRWSRIAALLTLAWGLGVFPVMAILNWGAPREITRDDAMTLVTRDVAWKLRASAGSKPINVLSGPTTTSMLAFF